MTIIEHALPQEIPEALWPYRTRYERKQKQREYRGVYAHDYAVLYPLYMDRTLSYKVIAERLQLEYKTPSSPLSSVHQLYFPTVPRHHVKKSKASRAEERAGKERSFKIQSEKFKALETFCESAGLIPSILWSPREVIYNDTFDIGGVSCYVEFVLATHRISGKNAFVARVGLPFSKRSAWDREFAIAFLNIEQEGMTCKDTYIFPLGENRPTEGNCVNIPIGPRSHRRTTRKIDYELYRGENGLALLRATIEKKRSQDLVT